MKYSGSYMDCNCVECRTRRVVDVMRADQGLAERKARQAEAIEAYVSAENTDAYECGKNLYLHNVHMELGSPLPDGDDAPNSVTGGQGFSASDDGRTWLEKLAQSKPDIYEERPPFITNMSRPGDKPGSRDRDVNLATANAAQRKATPVATGVIDYFPDALAAVAETSWLGAQQHNPGKPLFWDRSKSSDEADALMRHFLQRGTFDTDGVRHSAKVAWRALALLQKEIEAARVDGDAVSKLL